MKSQTHAPSSAARNQCCLVQAWWPRGLGWQPPFGWRTPQEVTLVPVSVARAKRSVVVERLAAQRQQLKASRHQGGSSSSKSGRGSGCSGRKGLTPILFMLQGSTRSCLVYPLVCVTFMGASKFACMEPHLSQACISCCSHRQCIRMLLCFAFHNPELSRDMFVF